MVKSWRQITVLVLVLVAMVTGTVVGQATSSSKMPKVLKPARTVKEISADITSTKLKLASVIKERGDLSDRSKRSEMKANAAPLIRKMLDLFAELATVDDNFAKEDYQQVCRQLEPTLAMLQEERMLQELKKRGEGKDLEDAAYAKGTLILVRYLDARGDVQSQNALIGDFDKLAKQYPASEELVNTFTIARMSGVAMGEVQKENLDKALMNLKSPAASQMQQMIILEKKRKDRENKAIIVFGKTLDGKMFSTSSLRGKVVLVDFWATWCGPCVAEMPRVVEAYKKYRAQGFEIVGVSSDQTVDDLKEFLKENADITWPQLYETPVSGMNPLARQFDVDVLPTMFLIDRKGVLRSTDVRENLEEQVQKLLAEK